MKGDSVDKLADMLTVVFGISTAIIALAAAILPAVMAFLIDWRCLLLYPAMLAVILWLISSIDQPRKNWHHIYANGKEIFDSVQHHKQNE